MGWGLSGVTEVIHKRGHGDTVLVVGVGVHSVRSEKNNFHQVTCLRDHR